MPKSMKDLQIVKGLGSKVEMREQDLQDSPIRQAYAVVEAISRCFRVRSPEKVSAVLAITPDELDLLLSGRGGPARSTIEAITPFSIRCGIAFESLEDLESIGGSDKESISALLSLAGRRYIIAIVEGREWEDDVIAALVHGATPNVVKVLLDSHPLLQGAAYSLLDGVGVPLILKQMLGVIPTERAG